MNKKNIAAIVIVLLVIIGAFWYMSWHKSASITTDGTIAGDSDRMASPASDDAAGGKLKVANFSGKLSEVNTGCFADGECYVVVDGKHITTTMGWSQETMGTVQGVDSFGDLESHIGENVEVYAKDNADGTYTLYGSNGFYVKLITDK